MQGTPKGRGRVLGIGGVFLKSAHSDRLRAWYADNLGIAGGPDGATFAWRGLENPEVEQLTVWSVFPGDSNYFDPSPTPFMINYIVDDLDAVLEGLAAKGVAVDPKREDYPYGRFACWEPRGAGA